MVSEHKAAESSNYGSARMKPDDADGSASDVAQHISDAREQISRYIAAQSERVLAIARSAALFGALGIVAAVVGLTVVVTAAVLLCVGFADAIAALLGGRQWAGDILTGGIVIGTIGVVAFLVVNRTVKAARKRTVSTWAQRRSQGSAT